MRATVLTHPGVHLSSSPSTKPGQLHFSLLDLQVRQELLSELSWLLEEPRHLFSLAPRQTPTLIPVHHPLGPVGRRTGVDDPLVEIVQIRTQIRTQEIAVRRRLEEAGDHLALDPAVAGHVAEAPDHTS